MIFSTAALLLLGAFLSAPQASPVPVEEEPSHRLAFGNPHVRVFDVWIEPGGSTLFHTHVNDGIGIKLGDARIRDEKIDGASKEALVARGDVDFSYRPVPLTHRVVNIGTTRFLNTFVEILPGEASSVMPLPELSPGRGLVLENERVRVSRQILAPGRWIEIDVFAQGFLGVALSTGTIAIEAAGRTATATLAPGDSRWHEGGTKNAWKNVGETRFEVVAIELK
jgi:hypothetical protein